jgi:PAS domain S-box-containing protein
MHPMRRTAAEHAHRAGNLQGAAGNRVADKACAHPAKLATMHQQDKREDRQMARADKGKAGKKGSKADKGSPSRRKDLAVVAPSPAHPAMDRRAQASSRPKVIIAGAGLGGLVLALIILLAVAVAEQAARSVARQHALLQAQAEEMRRLALVAEHTANAVIILDAQRRIVWMNASVTRMTGFRLSDVHGQAITAALAVEGMDAGLLAQLRQRLAAEGQLRGDVRVRSKGGRDTWVSIDMQPVRNPQGAITGWVVVAADIDEQVRQRQQRRALFEALPTGVMVYSKSGQVQELNHAAMEILGMDEASMHDSEHRQDTAGHRPA